jgi:hypothetical protein
VKKYSLPAIATLLSLSMAAGAEWEGRVVDTKRAAVAGAKVTLHPQGITAITDGNGIYRLSGSTGLGNQPSRTSHTAQSLAGLRMGFQSAPELPARDLSGRHIRPEGNRWVLIAPLPSSPAIAPAQPLGKTAVVPPLAYMSVASSLTAEKLGYQTANIPLAAGAAIPDIILAPGFDLSRPAQLKVSNDFIVPALPRAAGFTGSTSTELPNVQNPDDSSTAGAPKTTFSLKWDLVTDTGVQVFVRRHSYFPLHPESAAATPPNKSSGDSGRIMPEYHEVADTVDGNRGAQYVYLHLWKKASGIAFGTMQCLQFPGPMVAGKKAYYAFLDLHRVKPLSVATHFSGEVPALDTCGKVAGKVAWKGPGPMPELWIGMPGTELFTAVAADGAFLTTDLPPGNPPVVLVRVNRSGDGSAVPSAVHVLEGLEVISGQTSVLNSIELSGE